jgi:tetratricopeptide (TPR) repeat protein
MKKTLQCLSIFPAIFFLAAVISSCNSLAASAEEYYAIGMAYFEMGKFDEAERWLNRARSADRTMAASEYNLGRIAFETQRYEEAAALFERILRRDPDNVLALRAAAYTRIKTGDIDIAEKHYTKLLNLVPESADDGYNHALVLYVLHRYADAEAVLEKYPVALKENSDLILLYARCQNALDKVEAIDSYAKWLGEKSDIKVRYEYAQLLERHNLYARALEEYHLAISAAGNDTEPNRIVLRFALAKLLLIADSESEEGIIELGNAITDGFNDIEAIEKLYNDERIGTANRDKLRVIIHELQHPNE